MDAATGSFVFVSGPSPSEAEHLYDHFFSEYDEEKQGEGAGYTTGLIKEIHARRAQSDLHGALFYDNLLALALQAEASSAAAHSYPPKPGKHGLLTLIELFASSSFDRIRKTAMVYYLILDLNSYTQRGQSNASRFVKECGLPTSTRNAMTGYWHLDRGEYRVGVSYLEQPDFVTRILQVLSPLPHVHASNQEAKERAVAFSNFLKMVDDEARMESVEEGLLLEEAEIVSICWTQGLYAAWKQGQQWVTSEAGEAEEQQMSRCLARLVEFCFMPFPKKEAVKQLLSLPMSSQQEALLSHIIVNPPPNITLSSLAHATALDSLFVRYINSGRYIEAVLLDRRITSSIGMAHLSRETRNEAEREKLRKLRGKREGLVKGALSVLSRIERTMFDLGVDFETNEAKTAEPEAAGSEASWERVGLGMDETHVTNAPERAPQTPLSASASFRIARQGTPASDPLLTAVARASPLSQMGSPFARPSIGSPLRPSRARGNTSIATEVRIASEGALSPSSRSGPPHVGVVNQEDSSYASPSRGSRPYQLSNGSGLNAGGSHSGLPRDGTEGLHEADDSKEDDQGSAANAPEDSGPMNRLAKQLEDEVLRNNTSIEEILKRSSSSTFSPFRNLSGSIDKKAHSSLTFPRPQRRYEPKYEIGGDKSTHAMELDETLSTAASPEAPTRRGPRQSFNPRRYGQRGANRSKRQSSAAHEEEAGDTSVPGSFPGLEEDVSPAKSDSAQLQGKANSRRNATRRGQPRKETDDIENLDTVPEMTEVNSALRKSKSAASNLSVPKASTPLRRSARLSVEPESQEAVSPIRRRGAAAAAQTTPKSGADEDGVSETSQSGRKTRRQRSSRSASPSKPKPSVSSAQSPTKTRSRRGASQAPSDAGQGDDEGGGEGVSTRTPRRRKAAP